MIDALASMPHCADHIAPVFSALPDAGTFYRRIGAIGNGPPAIVASFSDSRWAHQRDIIYMEHGTGQRYAAGQPSYAGGKHKDHVSLFLSPSEAVAAANRTAYPHAEHAVIGCPLLDRWIGIKPRNSEPVVAFAWHFNAVGVAPEATSAFRYYAEAIPHLPFRMLGHGHPRAMRVLRRFYDAHGIEIAESLDEVMQRADVLVFDNTSAGFMFAATGRPVVVLDAPWYHARWGGRFWDWADVGVRIGSPSRLRHAIEEALEDRSRQRHRREEIVSEIYPYRGMATQRAVAAINDWAATRMQAVA